MTKTIKPAPGKRVRRPENGFKPLPDEGMLVEWSSYYERLLADGDVVLVDEPTGDQPAKADRRKGGEG